MSGSLDFQPVVAAKAARVCRCGRKKSLGGAFCTYCWNHLPVAVQRRVYPVGGRLDAAGYGEACRLLELRAQRRAAERGEKGD